MYGSITDTEAYIAGAMDIAKKMNVQDYKRGPVLAKRTWNAVTEDEMQKKFEGCQLQVATNCKLVFLTDNEVNVPVFEHLLEAGRPFIIECSPGKINDDFWNAAAVADYFGDTKTKVKVMNTNRTKEMTLRKMFKSLTMKGQHEEVKIADYPEKELELRWTVPRLVQEFSRIMPFQRHMLPTGPLNMVIK